MLRFHASRSRSVTCLTQFRFEANLRCAVTGSGDLDLSAPLRRASRAPATPREAGWAQPARDRATLILSVSFRRARRAVIVAVHAMREQELLLMRDTARAALAEIYALAWFGVCWSVGTAGI